MCVAVFIEMSFRRNVLFLVFSLIIHALFYKLLQYGSSRSIQDTTRLLPPLRASSSTLVLHPQPPLWQRGERVDSYMNSKLKELHSNFCFTNNSLYYLKGWGITPALIIDVGANIGSWAQMAQVVFPDAHLMLVEVLIYHLELTNHISN